jgi:hypothetical protein
MEVSRVLHRLRSVEDVSVFVDGRKGQDRFDLGWERREELLREDENEEKYRMDKEESGRERKCSLMPIYAYSLPYVQYTTQRRFAMHIMNTRHTIFSPF